MHCHDFDDFDDFPVFNIFDPFNDSDDFDVFDDFDDFDDFYFQRFMFKFEYFFAWQDCDRSGNTCRQCKALLWVECYR